MAPLVTAVMMGFAQERRGGAMDTVREHCQTDDRLGVEQRQQFDKSLRLSKKRSTSIQDGDGTTPPLPKRGRPAKGLHECPDRFPQVIPDDRRRKILQDALVHERALLLERQDCHIAGEWNFLTHAQPVKQHDVVAHREIVGTRTPLQVSSGSE